MGLLTGVEIKQAAAAYCAADSGQEGVCGRNDCDRNYSVVLTGCVEA
jgi:hypothetical protein